MALSRPLHWLEISRGALLRNLKYFRHLAGNNTKIMAMVKANAYGHGLETVVPLMADKVDFYGVNTFAEAVAVRRLVPESRILVTAPVSPEHFPLAVKFRISLCVHSLNYLKNLNRYPVSVHLKINTGMNRLGLSMIDLLSALEIIRHSQYLELEGIYSHFYSADSDSPATFLQFDMFQQAVFQTKYYFSKVIAHCANTAAAVNFPRTHLDMIRPGIGLYGLWPELEPVLSWKCRPVQVRTTSAGETVGYSAAFTCQNGTMAVLPVGYSDGLDRKLSNQGTVWSDGHFFPIIGNISMNFTAIDISGRPSVSKTPVFELLGPHITAGAVAKLLNTVNYEIVSRINPAIPRIIVK